MPGTLTGTRPQFVRYAAGQYAYNPDRNNVAPSAGVAWQVPPSTGVMKWLRGSEEGDVVVRGGWAMAFQRPGMSDFTGVFGDNQGIQATLQADQNDQHAADPAAQQSGAARRPDGIAARGAGVDHHPWQRLRSEHPDALHAVVVGRLAAQGHERLRDRVPLRRQQARQRLGFDQHQRAEHHHQRLPQRVPPGAGQPAGQHRRRPRRDVRLHGRRLGHQPAADFPGALQRRRTPPMPATPRSTRVRNGPTRRTSVSLPRAIRIRGASRRRAPAA